MLAQLPGVENRGSPECVVILGECAPHQGPITLRSRGKWQSLLFWSMQK